MKGGKKGDFFNPENADDKSKKMHDFLKKVSKPFGTNESHKYKLLEKLEKEEMSLNYSYQEKQIKSLNLKDFFRFPAFRLSFSSAMIFIVLFVFFYMFFIYNKNGNINIAFNVEKGKAAYHGKELETNKSIFVKPNDIVKTDSESILKINVENSVIRLFGSSELKFLKIKKQKENIFNSFELIKGKIFCEVTLPGTASIFKVTTNNSVYTVKGTKFYLEVAGNNDNVLNVTEGTVEISGFIKNGVFKNKDKDPEIYDKIIKLINQKEYVKADETVSIDTEKLIKFNNELTDYIKRYFINDNGLSKKEIAEKITEMENRSRELIKRAEAQPENVNQIEIDNKVKIKKITKFANLEFSESGTGISCDGRFIYISSDFDRSIYCIDPILGKLKWQFKDQDLKNVTCLVQRLKDNIIFGTPENIYQLSTDGKIIQKLDFKNGLNYWAGIVGTNQILYIPGQRNLYQYNGITLKLQENFPESMGQLFISVDGNYFYCNDLNSLDIFAYNLNEKKLTAKYEKLKSRAFMAPVKKGDYLIIADSTGNIYKYHVNDESIKPDIVSIGAGILNMINKDNIFYFMASDGYFYKLDFNQFRGAEKIAKADENPAIDKYLTKRLFLDKNKIYYSSDTGKIFEYNIASGKWNFIFISDNINKISLIGQPVKIGDAVYFIDAEANLYGLSIN